MKTKNSFFCTVVLGVASAAVLMGQPVGAAEEASDIDCQASSCFVGDYNVGGGGLFEIGGGMQSSGAAGFFSNAEAVFLDREGYDSIDDEATSKLPWYLKDITFFDGRLMSFIGASVAPGMDGTLSAQFRLKLVGSLGGGLMLYQIFPITLALEDASLEIKEGQVSGGGLVGSTVVIPVSLLAGMDAANLYVSMTAGVRLSSELNDPGFALQPKVRFLSDKVSLEARALFTVGSEEKEQKASLLAAINHVFVKGDQVGLLVGASRISTPGFDDRKGMEILFFYGRNL